MNIPKDFSPKKILIVQLRQLGDVLLTTPVIKPLKERFPDATLSFLTEKNAYGILSGNPYLDEIIAIPRKSSISEQIKVIFDIRRRGFDLILDYMTNPKTAYISLFSRAKIKVTNDRSLRRFAYDIRVNPVGGYSVDYKLSMLIPFGIIGAENTPSLFIPQEAQDKAAAFLKAANIRDGDFVVCIDATHRRITRKWTGKGFAEVADRLKEQYNAKVIFLWGPGEREEVEGIMSMCRHRHIIDPGTDIKGLAALLKRADILIGNCSFPRHVAVSQGTPTLVVLGATSEGWTHPSPIHQTVRKGLPCQPCNKIVCADLRCMTTLTADEVIARCMVLLQQSMGQKPEINTEIMKQIEHQIVH